MYKDSIPIETLLGKTITKIDVTENKERVRFTCADGTAYEMYHEQDCCEEVYLEDVAGTLDDLIGAPILQAEVVSQSNNHEDKPDVPPAKGEWDESWTWTFYKLATIKGYVTLRWYGTSNGYYSEDVSLCDVTPTGGGTQ